MRGEYYDVHSICIEFLGGSRGPERRELVRTITHAMRDDAAMKQVVAELAEQFYKNNSTPVQGIAQSIMYGIVMGIWLEQERANRKKVVV